MAISWGPTEGNMQVGIEVRHDAVGSSTTSINVYVDFYIRAVNNWNFADNQRLTKSGSISGAYDFFNGVGTNGSMKVGTHTIANQGLSYGGGPTYTFAGTISGHYAGATPAHSIRWTLPARPASVPSAPGVTISSVTASSAFIDISAPASNGSTIVQYEVQVDNASNFSSVDRTLGGDGTVSSLAPATTYYVRARARNGVGWGPYSATRSFTTGATAPGTPGTPTISAVSDSGATVTWTAPGSTGGSAIDEYDVQIATDSGFTANLQTIISEALSQVLTGLVPGTTYYVRVRARNGVGNSGYTTAAQFTTLTGTPVIVNPSDGSTIGLAYPSVLVGGIGPATSRTITAQFSTDPSFATNVKTVNLSPSSSSADGRYLVADTSQYLANGNWYVRARVTNTATGYVTPWSTTTGFTSSHIPSASVVSPSAGQTASYTASTLFTWRFTDAGAPQDTQSAYRLVIETNAGGEVIFDSGKTAGANLSRSVAIANTYKGVGLRWRVMVWDKGDTPSAWTGYSLFTLADPPAITILEPTGALPVDTGSPTFSWAVAIPSGGVQAKAVVTVFDADNGQVVWTSTINGTGTKITPPVVILRNNHAYYYTLAVTDNTGLVGTVTTEFVTSYNAPDAITYSVDAGDVDEFGFVAVNWANANPDDMFTEWKVYRRLLGGQWELLATIANQNVRAYRDYLVEAGQTYSYSVTQVATRSGVLLESSVGYYLDAEGNEIDEGRTYFLDLRNYWLINRDDPDLSLKLVNVISNPTTLEFESETYNIIGRGRHRDYGDELGVTGSIVCQVRTPERISTFKQAIEALRRRQEAYHLRTPFAELYQVALGNIQWEPLAGVGAMQMGDLSFDYEEVR